jgi:hypothetical protein
MAGALWLQGQGFQGTSKLLLQCVIIQYDLYGMKNVTQSPPLLCASLEEIMAHIRDAAVQAPFVNEEKCLTTQDAPGAISVYVVQTMHSKIFGIHGISPQGQVKLKNMIVQLNKSLTTVASTTK